MTYTTEEFLDIFPTGVSITEEVALHMVDDFSWPTLARALLTGDYFGEYALRTAGPDAIIRRHQQVHADCYDLAVRKYKNSWNRGVWRFIRMVIPNTVSDLIQRVEWIELTAMLKMNERAVRAHRLAMASAFAAAYSKQCAAKTPTAPIEFQKLDWKVKSLSTVDFAPFIWVAEGPFWDYEVHLSKDGKYIAWEAGVPPFDTLEQAQQHHQDSLDSALREWVSQH